MYKIRKNRTSSKEQEGSSPSALLSLLWDTADVMTVIKWENKLSLKYLQHFQGFVVIHLYCFKGVVKQGECVCELLFMVLIWHISLLV